MTNYTSFTKRIKGCTTIEQLDKLSESLTRLYDNYIFSESEFSRLDLKIVDKIIELDI